MGKSSHNRDLYLAKIDKETRTPGDFAKALCKSPFRQHRKNGEELLRHMNVAEDAIAEAMKEASCQN